MSNKENGYQDWKLAYGKVQEVLNNSEISEQDFKSAYDIADKVLNGTYKHVSPDDEAFHGDFHENAGKQISIRDEEYTKLLKHFIFVTKTRNFIKEVFKWGFCTLIFVLMILAACITYDVFKRIMAFKAKQMIQFIPVLIAAITSLASTIIVIPITIVKYLFSTKEDDNITEIIRHTQDHDAAGREWIEKFYNDNSDDSNNIDKP